MHEVNLRKNSQTERETAEKLRPKVRLFNTQIHSLIPTIYN